VPDHGRQELFLHGLCKLYDARHQVPRGTGGGDGQGLDNNLQKSHPDHIGSGMAAHPLGNSSGAWASKRRTRWPRGWWAEAGRQGPTLRDCVINAVIQD